MSEGFVSPLRVTVPGSLHLVDFGRPAAVAAVTALEARLNGVVFGLLAGLPAELQGEAEGVLRGYSGERSFIGLFYRPVWSFLAWLPAADPALLDAACRAQALSLFLHLWDDHLSDGQLAPDLVRLHLRSLAWQGYEAATGELAMVAGAAPGVRRELVERYLSSVHRPGRAATLEAHCARMVDQVGIWRVTPLLYGTVVGGPAGADAACRVVERFSVAWRIVDDVQDAAEDVVSGQDNALCLALDGAGRAAWEACAAASRGTGGLDVASWAVVERSIQGGALSAVVARADAEVAAAEGAALAGGWAGLAGELRACRVGGGPSRG